MSKKNQDLFSSSDGSLFADIQTIQELSDVLVLDGGWLLDQGSALGDLLDVVTFKDQLVLLRLAVGDGDTGNHADFPDVLLSQEVSDLYQGSFFTDGAIDGEMSVYSSHLVLETLKQK